MPIITRPRPRPRSGRAALRIYAIIAATLLALYLCSSLFGTEIAIILLGFIALGTALNLTPSRPTTKGRIRRASQRLHFSPIKSRSADATAPIPDVVLMPPPAPVTPDSLELSRRRLKRSLRRLEATVALANSAAVL